MLDLRRAEKRRDPLHGRDIWCVAVVPLWAKQRRRAQMIAIPPRAISRAS